MSCKELRRNINCAHCNKKYMFEPSVDTARAQLTMHFPECPKCGLESVVKISTGDARILQLTI